MTEINKEGFKNHIKAIKKEIESNPHDGILNQLLKEVKPIDFEKKAKASLEAKLNEKNLTADQMEKIQEAITNSLSVFTSTPPSEKLLTRKETADKLKISLVTLNDWTKRGMIQSYIIGGRVLYKESEIEKSLHQVRTVKY